MSIANGECRWSTGRQSPPTSHSRASRSHSDNLPLPRHPVHSSSPILAPRPRPEFLCSTRTEEVHRDRCRLRRGIPPRICSIVMNTSLVARGAHCPTVFACPAWLVGHERRAGVCQQYWEVVTTRPPRGVGVRHGMSLTQPESTPPWRVEDQASWKKRQVTLVVRSSSISTAT